MPPLLREVIGDVLRRARTHRAGRCARCPTPRGSASGYLSEVERGRKEASSELLSAICDALDVPLSEVLTDAGEQMARQERAAHGRRRRARPTSTPAPRSSSRRSSRWPSPSAGAISAGVWQSARNR